MKTISETMLIKEKGSILKTHILSKVLLLSYLPINIFIALLTPRNILDYPWARSFADFTAQFIPLVAKIGKTAVLPELYFTAAAINLMVIIFTFFRICLVLTLEREQYINFIMVHKYSKKDKIKIFLRIPFVLLCLWFILFSSLPVESALTGSKLSMGAYGSFFFGVWYLLGENLIYIFYLYILRRHNF